MLNSQSKEYFCQKNDIINYDTSFRIKHNSIWNYNTNSQLIEEKLNIPSKLNDIKLINNNNDNDNDKNSNVFDRNTDINQNIVQSHMNNKNNSSVINKLSKTPKNKLKNNSFNTNNTSSLLSFYPSSPTSPTGFTILNEKKEYKVLWSPSMETPTLNRTLSHNPSYFTHSNIATPENIKYSKSKSLISIPTNISIEFINNQQNIASNLNNNSTPNNNLKFTNSTLTTPNSPETNKISKISEQSSLFKNVFSDNKYLSSPMISPDYINTEKTHFRNLFYKDISNKDNKENEDNNHNNIGLISEINNNTINNNKEINLNDINLKKLHNDNVNNKEINTSVKNNVKYNKNDNEIIQTIQSSPKFSRNKRLLNSAENPLIKRQKHTHNQKNKVKKEHHCKEVLKKKQDHRNQLNKLTTTPKLKRTKFISVDEFDDNEEDNINNLSSSNYIRTTPKIENRFTKNVHHNENNSGINLLKEFKDIQSSSKGNKNGKEKDVIKKDLINIDSLKGIYSVLENDSILSSLDFNDEDQKSILNTPNINDLNLMNDLPSSPLLIHDSNNNINKLDNSKDDLESFDYGSDNIDYTMVKENHIITQAYQLLKQNDKNNSFEETLIDKSLDSSDIHNSNNVFDIKENNELFKINIDIDNKNNENIDNNKEDNTILFDPNPFKNESQINELTNLYNEFNNNMISPHNNSNLVNSINNIKKQKSDLDSEFGLALNEIIDQDDSLFDDDDESEEIITNLNIDENNSLAMPPLIIEDNNVKLDFDEENVTFHPLNEVNDNNINKDIESNNINFNEFKTNNSKNLPKLNEEILIETEKSIDEDKFKEFNNLKNIIQDDKNEKILTSEISKFIENNKQLSKKTDKTIIDAKKVINQNIFNDLNTKTIRFEELNNLQQQSTDLTDEEIEDANRILNDGLFDDDDSTDDDNNNKNNNNTYIENRNKNQLQKLSKENIIKTKTVLNDNIYDDNINIFSEKILLSKTKSTKAKLPEFTGFKTGNGKELQKLSKEAIANAKKILGDDLFDDNMNTSEIKPQEIKPFEFTGFKTGNGKELPKLSKEAIANAKKILGDDLFDDNMNSSEIKPQEIKPLEFTGFKTGNGKELPKLSKETIANAKKILGDDLFDDNMNTSEIKPQEIKPLEFTGFKTGNGKELPKLSKEAIANAKKILGDDLFDDNMNTSETKPQEIKPLEFTGFKTGNGKELPKLSKEAIANAKKILGDDLFDDNMNTSEIKPQEIKAFEFNGFKKGNGKELPKLSKEAIENAKKILGDDLFEDKTNIPEAKPQEIKAFGFNGFKTGNGKELPKLSKEAIANAKKILGDDLINKDSASAENNNMLIDHNDDFNSNLIDKNKSYIPIKIDNLSTVNSSSFQLINNKIFKKDYNNNKENEENNYDKNQTYNKKDNSINNFSRKFMNNKKSILQKDNNIDNNNEYKNKNRIEINDSYFDSLNKMNETKKSLAEVFRFLPQNFTQEHIEKIL
ncbi:hypothetical protein BCR32DRAFT_243931 [Anaeromyces robustus]|uniref:Uncharacterized protein n=1 Tax=Anaeromyces robustus TaxID=1754192 RepID=A0A1Y1XBB3_9FUNG|nr:hypothetical protein BCR32DRAFT_243931 [Anaeromyces robustus]|eukprot:ORX82726.1 hypothetical protein BCR32DRAFT_243931 [Anaeromyces robustus]